MNFSKSERGLVVNFGEMFVGIDIAKYKHFAKILFNDGSESAPFCFDNSRSGFESLLVWLAFNKNRRHCNSIIVGLESTGHYWEPLAFFLDGQPGLKLVQVNPKYVKKTKELYDNTPGKTDRKDAGIIAMLMRMGKFQKVVIPRGEFADLRGYAKLREQKIVDLGVHRNILHSLVDTIFPEYGSLFRKLESKTSLHILKNYTTPEKLVEVGAKKLSSVLRKVSYGKHSYSAAEGLIHAASTTIGLKEGTAAIEFAIRSNVEVITKIQDEIKKIEERLSDVLHTISYSQQLLSMPGVGPISLAIILGEAGDLRRYEKAGELIKLAGLNLFEISSGNHKGQKHITKRGRALLRKCLFFAALRTVKTGGAFRSDYLRLTQKNQMHKTKALIALSRKLLRVLFALVRDGVAYNQKGVVLLAA